MDLPTCPHCGQSVLDDDVDECPFCGESMSAKPSAKKKPQAAKTEPQKSVAPSEPDGAEAKMPAERPAKKKKRPAEKASGGDEPFGVDQSAMSNAVPLRPKPTKGRTYKVVCPMCETAGYTSPKAGGRDVKCPNPKCLVPIFTCPEPPPAPVEDEEPETSGLSTAQLGLMSLAALAIVGVGIWFFVIKPEDTPPSPGNADPEIARDQGDNKNGKAQQNEEPSEEAAPPEPKGPDLVALREQAPERMIEASHLPSGRTIQRPKPLRVQWTALALAELGQLDQTQEQLDRLSQFKDDSPHYRVLPWVEIGWKHYEREESAEDAATKALEFVRDEPASSQESWRQVVSLSALLAALDRADEALPLFQRDLGRLEDQELWADLMAVTLDHTFNLEALEPVRPLVTPVNPAWSGVVWQLVFHDSADAGLRWASRASDEATRGEALLAWGEAVVARALATGQSADYSSLDPAIAKLPEPWSGIFTARSSARMGQRFAADDETAAATLLEKAEAALSAFPEKAPMQTPDLEAIHAGNFPFTPANSHRALAAFEVARLQSTLNQRDKAWKSIEQGLEILRSESLPLKTARDLVADAKSQRDFLRSQLRSTLSLPNEDQARQAYRAYLKNVYELQEQAEQRLRRQATLLSEAARWNLAERVYQEITREPEGQAKDSYFATDLPWVVLSELQKSDSEKAGDLQTRLRQQRRSKPAGQKLLEESADWMAKEPPDIGNLIAKLGRGTKDLPDPVRRRWLFRLASRKVLNGETQQVLPFLLALYKADPFLGEDAAELIAALATRNGQGEIIWQNLKGRDWSPTQKIAGYRGFVAAATPLRETPTPETETE